MIQDCCKQCRKSDGFTLIEIVIYTGLFSLVMALVLTAFFQIYGSQSQNQERIEVDSEANFIMQKIFWALSGAQTINQPALSATSSVLSVNKYNFAGNPLVFDLMDGKIRLSRASAAAAPFSNDFVKISKLEFKHNPSQDNVPESVNIILSVIASSSVRAVVSSTTLQSIIYLRK
ncbi:MAG TPA: prepilin-type N-terminal cleavage/methylation domain-containing protein [Candidatus Paceibacterota bacterium]